MALVQPQFTQHSMSGAPTALALSLMVGLIAVAGTALASDRTRAADLSPEQSRRLALQRHRGGVTLVRVALSQNPIVGVPVDLVVLGREVARKVGLPVRRSTRSLLTYVGLLGLHLTGHGSGGSAGIGGFSPPWEVTPVSAEEAVAAATGVFSGNESYPGNRAWAIGTAAESLRRSPPETLRPIAHQLQYEGGLPGTD